MSQSEKRVVQFLCPKCGKQLRAAAQHAGRRSKCPRCQTKVVIPEAEYRLEEEASQPRSPQPAMLKVICPICQTVMQAEAAQVGQTIQCPECATRSTVVAPVERAAPKPRQKTSDDLYALADDDEPPVQKTYIPLHCGRCGTLMHAEPPQIGRPIECPDCGTKTVVPAPVSVPVAPEHRSDESLETYDVQETPGQPAPDSPAYETYFPVHCPRCSTRMLATRRQLGTQLTCPDCGTSVRVPTFDEVQERMADDRVDVLEPVEGYAVKVSPDSPSAAAIQPALGDDALHAATLQHGERPETSAHPFWSGNLAVLVRWPGWTVWLGLTMFGCLPAWLGRAALLLGEGDAGGGYALIGPWIMSLVLTATAIFFTAIWGVAASFLGLAILRDTGAGNEQIENWPDAVWLDYLGETLYVVNAAALSALAAYGMHRLLMLAGIDAVWAIAGVALLSYPFFILSLLEANSPWWPFSPPTLQSLFFAAGGWLQFHLVSLLVLLPLGALAAFLNALLGGWGALPIAALVTTAWMLYFRLLGRLAWYCADHSPVVEEEKEE